MNKWTSLTELGITVPTAVKNINIQDLSVGIVSMNAIKYRNFNVNSVRKKLNRKVISKNI